MTEHEIERRFTYHAPRAGQAEDYQSIRASVREVVEVIEHVCPDCREKSLAVTKLEEAVFWANASIARRE